MFGLELWDLSVGFVTCLVLVNLYPRLALAGGWIVNKAKAVGAWARAKVSG
jgi:hypothetical protein